MARRSMKGAIQKVKISITLKHLIPNHFKPQPPSNYMGDESGAENYSDRFFSEINTRIRDLEEKQRLLKDKMLLISESFVKERDKNFKEIQDMKKVVIQLKEENDRVKDLLLRLGENIDKTARKEELMILQRQFDLFRKN
jgi:hypothetical protein